MSPNKIGQTDREEKRIKTLEEELEVAKKSLELRKTDVKPQLEELNSMSFKKKPMQKQKPTKSRQKTWNRRTLLGEYDTDE